MFPSSNPFRLLIRDDPLFEFIVVLHDPVTHALHHAGLLIQVTNPPIDPLREGLVMSMEMRLGGRGNLLEPGPKTYQQVWAGTVGRVDWGTVGLGCKGDMG